MYRKILSKVQELRVHGGIVLAIATKGDAEIVGLCAGIYTIPDSFEPFSPHTRALAVPIQFPACHIAPSRGSDVDGTRKLAKTVAVE